MRENRRVILSIYLVLLTLCMCVEKEKGTPSPTATLDPTTSTPSTPAAVHRFDLSGVIFFDYNGNGTRDSIEPPIPNVKIRVENIETESEGDGSYVIKSIPEGYIDVEFSADGFTYISLSRREFKPITQLVTLKIAKDMRRDWGLMQGFLTLPFKHGTQIDFIIYVDLDPSPHFRDWKGSDGSDYVKDRTTFNGHLGIDFAVPENTEVVVAAPGVVVEAESGWPNSDKAKDLHTGLADDGNRIVIDHGNGMLTIYCHLNSVSVSVGQFVKRGDVIGLSGRTGTFGKNQPAHLHFQFGGFGRNRIDPYRDLFGLSSENYWTKDNDPQFP